MSGPGYLTTALTVFFSAPGRAGLVGAFLLASIISWPIS